MVSFVTNVNVSGGSSVAPPPPSLAEVQGFQKDIKGTSTEDLAKKLGDPGMPPWKQQEVVKELLQRLEQAGKDHGGLSPDEQQLLNDLKGKGAHGKNGGDMIAKLLEALGVPHDMAVKAGQALAGGVSDQASSGDNHISGQDPGANFV